jgi:Protein of unknown function (DUF3293)
MNKSLISDVLIDAYASTNYVVESKPNFTLRVGSQCEELARIYEKANVSTACFITAYNPFSVLFTPPHNVARQADLLSDIASLRLKSIYGYGQGKDTDWMEPSVLILGISSVESMRLAIKHEQNAFIWCDEQATPKLVLTR